MPSGCERTNSRAKERKRAVCEVSERDERGADRNTRAPAAPKAHDDSWRSALEAEGSIRFPFRFLMTNCLLSYTRDFRYSLLRPAPPYALGASQHSPIPPACTCAGGEVEIIVLHEPGVHARDERLHVDGFPQVAPHRHLRRGRESGAAHHERVHVPSALLGSFALSFSRTADSGAGPPLPPRAARRR